MLSVTLEFPFPHGLDLDFIFAARRGDLPHLQSLAAEFKSFPFADVRTPQGYTALYLAAQNGKTSTCRFLIEVLNFDINVTDEQGRTPLFGAVLGKHRTTTLFLIENGADITHRNEFGDTPLHYVAQRGTRETMKLLISKGADVRAISQRGMPIHFAVRGVNRDVLEYILDLTGDPNPNISAPPPLYFAMQMDSIECVGLLLQAGAKPNCQCYYITPLHSAAHGGDERLIRCLLDAGADSNIPDSVGYTPLDHAALLGRRDVVKLLFPVTKRTASYPEWTVNGVMQHANSSKARQLFESKQKKVALLFKKKGKQAFERKDYSDAYNWFSLASQADPFDSKLLSNMSLISTKFYYGELALKEAQDCINLEPEWAKGHYREGGAYMVLKDFEKAANSFSQALALDPGNKEIEMAHRAALADADKFSHWKMVGDLAE